MTPDDIEREAEEHYARREASVQHNIDILRGLFHGAAGLLKAEREAGLLAIERIANAQPGNDAAPARTPRIWPKIDIGVAFDDLPDAVQVDRTPLRAEIWVRVPGTPKYRRDGRSVVTLTLTEITTLGDVTEVLGDA